jgi:AcrR family transcriptional regulator
MYTCTQYTSAAHWWPVALRATISSVVRLPRTDHGGRKRRTPRGSLTRDRIVSAALALLARDGLAGVTMRGVAEELGAAPMSLYRHVGGHASLLELLRERVTTTEVPTPVLTGGWRDTLRGLLDGARAQLRRHPGAVVLFHSDNFRHPPAPQAVERALACLVEAGVPAAKLASTSAALWMFTVGSVLAEQSSAAAWPGEELGPTRRRPWLAAMRSELAASAPRVAAQTASWAALSHDEVYAEGLELLLAGIDRAGE